MIRGAEVFRRLWGWETAAMAEVDPEDDSRDRWVIWWYRYDPERRQRRNTVVAAFSKKREFSRRFRELSQDLERRKSTGESEAVEHVSGVLYEAGSRTSIRRMRETQGRLGVRLTASDKTKNPDR
jgi:hypothetical protein